MFKKGNVTVDIKGITSVIIAAILSGIISFAVATERLDAHVGNEYVHKDIQTLGDTFVRKDVQDAEWRAINHKLDMISKKLGIDL